MVDYPKLPPSFFPTQPLSFSSSLSLSPPFPHRSPLPPRPFSSSLPPSLSLSLSLSMRSPTSDCKRTSERGYHELSQSSGSSGGSSSGGSFSGRERRRPRSASGVLGACFPFAAVFTPRGGDDHSADVVFPSTCSNGSADGTKRYHGTLNTSSPRQTGSRDFTMADIQKATKNFSPSHKIGQGAFGTVYKGRLADGTVVAIKRANKTEYDTSPDAEFHNEISTLAKIEHLNLVKLMGYLEYKDEKIIVIEFVPNGTLREHLDGTRGNILDFATRLDIAIDVAHAITYLHMYIDHPIIHRDIKSANILLTEKLRAKVADFGFARLGATEFGVSHVITQVKGTTGYLDPEYLCTYQLTEKSDVYSFGVLLVELVSGRSPIESKRDSKERVTQKWAIKKYSEAKVAEILDPQLSQNPPPISALERILELAFQCLAPTKLGRPSMKQCGEVLWTIRKDFRDASSLRSPMQSLKHK